MLLSMCIVQPPVIFCRFLLPRLTGMRKIAWRHFAKMFWWEHGTTWYYSLFFSLTFNTPTNHGLVRDLHILGTSYIGVFIIGGWDQQNSGPHSPEVARPNLLLWKQPYAVQIDSNSAMSFVWFVCVCVLSRHKAKFQSSQRVGKYLGETLLQQPSEPSLTCATSSRRLEVQWSSPHFPSWLAPILAKLLDQVVSSALASDVQNAEIH